MVPAANYEIIAVRYGVSHSTKGDLFYRYGAYGEPDGPQDMDFFFYVLRDGRNTILVDTGYAPEAATRRPGRVCVTPPAEAVARLGITPADVAHVVITHLHWDHIGNLGLFPNAELIVPQADLDFWTDPIARNPQFWAHVESDAIEDVIAADREGRVRRSGAEEEVLPGITAITVGGHSRGQQVLVVQTAGGPVVLASDAAHLYEELELARPFAIMVDLERMCRAYALLADLQRDGATIVPGHDPQVTQRFATLGGEADGIGFRIA